MYTSREVGQWLAAMDNDACTDEEFVEAMIYFYKIAYENMNLNGHLTADDIKSFDIEKLTKKISDIMHEIIESEEVNTSAWWKQDITPLERDVCDYYDIPYQKLKPSEIKFSLRCRDAGLHPADADRYAILNTLLKYDIGMVNALLIDDWMNSNNEEIYELTYMESVRVLDLIKHAAKDKGIQLDYSKYSNEDIHEYLYFD